MAKDFEVIETERLLLRGINESDAELIVRWRSDPEVYRYFKSPHKISLAEHMNWYSNSYLESANRLDWICIEKTSDNRIGVFGLYKKETQAEINYLLAPEWQHKGFAAEAIMGLIVYAKKKWNSKQVVAEIHKNNYPSIALVKKLGFVFYSLSDPFAIFGIEV